MAKRFLFLFGVGFLFAGCGGSQGGETCAQPLVGKELCGADLARFCEERYDPAVNDDVCRQVLIDEGVDPARQARIVTRRENARVQQASDEAAQAEADRVARARRANRHAISLETTSTDDGLRYTVHAPRRTDSIPSDYDAAYAKAGHTFIVFPVTVTNDGRKPTDVVCAAGAGGNGFLLIDDRVREFHVDSNATLTAPDNAACGDNLQPGDTQRAEIVFQVISSIRPAHLLVWNPDEPGPEEGGTHLDVGL
jgi:hypothetical protein